MDTQMDISHDIYLLFLIRSSQLISLKSLALSTTIVQEAINPHNYGLILLNYNFLMPNDSSLKFGMCTGWDLIVLEI